MRGSLASSARAPRLVGGALACAAMMLAGCLAPHYSVAEDAASAPDAATLNLRWCSPMPDLPPASNPPPDWGCAGESLAGAPAPTVAVDGIVNDAIDGLEYCTPPLHNCVQVPYVPGSKTFSFPSNQEGNGIMYWHKDDTPYSATFWHSLVTVEQLDVGTLWLYGLDEVKKHFPLPEGKGMAIIGLRDCSGLSAAGARFTAFTAANQPTGTHFSLDQSTLSPVLTPTDMVGTGGLIDLEPVDSIIYAYVADGCIVASARATIESERVAYVHLVPSGFK